MESFDVIVVGGGPAGATCARFLSQGGARVAVLDRARFPRVKLCAGWLSAPIWDALAIAPRQYGGALWPWSRCHVLFAGQQVTAHQRGYFIRRFEFDDFLLARSGAARFEDTRVADVGRDGDHFVIGELRARYLVGAAGSHCPVARGLFSAKPRPPVGALELETPATPHLLAAARPGDDGEPELFLHDDLRGYSWNVPKTDWLNVGCGTSDPRQVRGAWQVARARFEARGHLPAEAGAALEHLKGHAYHLFDPAHLDDCVRGRALLIGDALGLAQPLTAEGILPAVVSGRVAAEAILAGTPERYGRALAAHPLLRDYAALFHLREAAAAALGRRPGAAAARRSWPRPLRDAAGRAVAAAFAWMFAGKPLPARRLVGAAARGAYGLAVRRRRTQEAQDAR